MKDHVAAVDRVAQHAAVREIADMERDAETVEVSTAARRAHQAAHLVAALAQQAGEVHPHEPARSCHQRPHGFRPPFVPRFSP